MYIQVPYVPIYLTNPTLPYRLPYCTLSIVGIESSYRKAYYILYTPPN